MKAKMNTWQKIATITVVTPVVWLFIVKVVDISKTPDAVKTLGVKVDEGFKQVNGRLDYFIGREVTNSEVVGKQ